MTYIPEHDFAYDRFGLLHAVLLSLAHDSISLWQDFSCSLQLLECLPDCEPEY